MAIKTVPSPTTTTTISATTSHKPRIRRGSRPTVYHCESKTRPGRYHVTDVARLSCSCEAGRARRACWHLKLCTALHEYRRRQQAQATASTVALAKAVA